MGDGRLSMTSLPSWVSSYIGIPWVEGGRDRDRGLDCYGAVRLVLEEHGGVRLPRFDTVGPSNLLAAHDEIEENVRAWRKVPIERVAPFDVVQMNRAFKVHNRFYVRPVHLGVAVGGGRVIHAEPDGVAGVVLGSLSDLRPRVHAVWRHATLASPSDGGAVGSPFDCTRLIVEPGMTITEIVAAAKIDEATLTHAEVWIGGARVERDLWRWVKPRPGNAVWIVVIPRGGNGLRIAALVGIALAATAITVFAPGLGVPLWAAVLGSAAVSIGGTYAVNKFLPAEAIKPETYAAAKVSNTYSLTGATNQRAPGAVVPVLLGRHKFVPRSGGQYTEVRGQKVYLHAIFVLSTGIITDPEIFIGETPISQFSGVDAVFTRGWHPRQLRDRGSWNPNAGFPSTVSARPGDKWTANRSSGSYVKGDIIVYNGLRPGNDDRNWDLNPGRANDRFPGDVYEERLAVDLLYGAPEVRSTTTNADRIVVDFNCPTLGRANEDGKYFNYTVSLQIYDSPIERPDDWRLVIGRLDITAGAGGPKEMFGTHSWTTSGASPSGKYNVRVKRTSEKNWSVDDQVWSDCKWIAIKTFTNRSPIPDVGVSTLTVEIEASGQLTGTLDNVSCIAQSVAWYWTGTKWAWGPTSNPAALVRSIYQMPHWSDPLGDGEIDLPRLAEWAEFCDRHKLEYNAYIDFDVPNIADFVGDIGIAGFAAMCRRGNLRSVAIDPVEGGTPVRLFVDGVNCWDSTTRSTLSDQTHAVRVSLNDARADWAAIERLVYADGQNLNTATRIVDKTFIGVTNIDQAFLIGRMALAESILRRESTETTTNIQGLSCEVGDVVQFANDDLAIGLARGRIVEVILAQDGTITGATLSGPVEMESGVDYGICYAVGGNKTVTISVIAEPGVTSLVTFARPPALAVAPEPDAVYSFGEVDREVMPLMISDIQPNDDGDVRLTLVSLPPSIAELKTKLPEWESYATLAKTLPAPVVTSVLSTAREMIVTAQGDLVTQVVITLIPISIPNTETAVMIRPTGVTDDYTLSRATNYGNGRIGIIGLEDGRTYDFRIVYTHPDYFPSLPADIPHHRVIGRIDPPEALKNLRLVVISSTLARLHWDPPEELDVRFGGRLIIRHSPETTSASWQRSTPLLSTDISASLLTITVPLMEGTYMVMTVDGSGNMSREYASISTDGASIDEFDSALNGTIVEEPLFLGQRYNVGVADGALVLLSGDFDSIADIDAMPNWDAIGLNVVNGGVYYFADTYDNGEVNRYRLRRRISQAADLIGDLISKRMLPISQWPSISGTIGAPVDVLIEVRSTTGDPTGSGAIWTPWTRLDAGEWVARAFQFRALLYTSDASFGVSVTQLQVFIEERVL